MSKKNKEQDLKINNKVKKDSTFWISIFILILMVASVVAFALSGAPSGGSVQNADQDFPFGQNFQNPETGELYWGARINGESFIFFNIDGYDQALIEAGLAKKIGEQTSIKIYVDEGYTSTESVFLVEKGLTGLGIGFEEIETMGVCESNVLVFTQNVSYSGDCMKFISNEDDAQLVADKVLYHLIKNFN